MDIDQPGRIGAFLRLTWLFRSFRSFRGSLSSPDDQRGGNPSGPSSIAPTRIPGRGLLLIACILLSFIDPLPIRTKIWLIGDSTMADKEVRAFPETGWGMPIAFFFDSTITVDNRAKNGRSTKSFIAEGRWQSVAGELKEGDYVFIQFGHNDEVPTKATYTPEDQFAANLVRFITESKNKKAFPLLITPVARRKFDSVGHIEETHATYAAIVRKVAAEQRVPLIDLDKSSQDLLRQFGPEESKFLFNYLEPKENPNYPEGSHDDTHFNELGARRMAELVLAAIRELKLPLAVHIRPPLHPASQAVSASNSMPAPRRTLVIASDGSGDYRTVQAAFDAIPLNNKTPITLFVRSGLYREKVHLDSTKDFITLLGEDPFNTILTYDDHPGKLSPQGDSINTRSSYSFLIRGDDFSAQNITFRNDAGFSAGQAVALEVQGDRARLRNCRIIGNQDILFLNSEKSRQYYQNCYIEGTTDFIFGAATAWFSGCHIHSKKNSHITAASTPPQHPYGFIFYDCTLTGDTAIHNASLGRPWRAAASVIYLHCYIDRFIRPEGWSNWNNTDNYRTARYGEYHNYGPGSDTTARVAWSHQLTDTAAQRITFKNIFGDWNPN